MINVEELGIFSIAGKDSEDKYNILRSFNKIKNHRRNSKYSDAYYPDKEYIEILNGKNPTYSGDIQKKYQIIPNPYYPIMPLIKSGVNYSKF